MLILTSNRDSRPTLQDSNTIKIKPRINNNILKVRIRASLIRTRTPSSNTARLRIKVSRATTSNRVIVIRVILLLNKVNSTDNSLLTRDNRITSRVNIQPISNQTLNMNKRVSKVNNMVSNTDSRLLSKDSKHLTRDSITVNKVNNMIITLINKDK